MILKFIFLCCCCHKLKNDNNEHNIENQTHETSIVSEGSSLSYDEEDDYSDDFSIRIIRPGYRRRNDIHCDIMNYHDIYEMKEIIKPIEEDENNVVDKY
uniref:Plasmodium yoelii subtelomeric region (PYST-C1) n=1 Tax=Parastrongyloides trichosuri TaxID=131310 RepID=A0A0N4ZJT5_PARTI